MTSDSLDALGSLTLWQRLQVRMHLMMCSLCSRFRKQAEFLRRAARAYAQAAEDDTIGPKLPDEVRDRIKKALRSDS